MYLAEVNAWDIVKKQYQYKLQSYMGVFTSLIVIQIIAILFSFNGTGMSGGGSSTFSYSLNYYSGSMILIFTMIWGLITAIIITSKAYRYDDYSFITNRGTTHTSNLLFLLSASIFAGITVLLCTHFIQVLYIYSVNSESVMFEQLTIIQNLKGISGTILYIFFFTSIGYFIGSLIQISRLFIFVLPVLFFGAVIADGLGKEQSMIPHVIKFFGNESSFGLFILKILAASALMYGFAIIISKKLEVRP
ncbi:hypothetical protein [Fictibacillus barbaricus]|uniref:ABC transporter permease n=1 Tax=Fictibacillus barbaricus TaxID=182136 RepID=A0ABU1U4F8_9BACL|nr:hypothetical protein [Fictibacillus barbaricus]MDR7074363.1 hypothetical protein [Fictibacillus barbaricus]